MGSIQGALLQTVGERLNLPGLAKTMEEAGVPGEGPLNHKHVLRQLDYT